MYAVEMRKITKRFGSFTANDQIDFLVKKGEIHCLLGENGAGKTTLMNVLFGLYKADEGELKINGKEIKKHSARNAFQCGLGMVHQHFMLVDALTVWENVVIGNEPGKFSRKCAHTVNIDIDRTADSIIAAAIVVRTISYNFLCTGAYLVSDHIEFTIRRYSAEISKYNII